jgi:hypothetical protein
MKSIWLEDNEKNCPTFYVTLVLEFWAFEFFFSPVGKNRQQLIKRFGTIYVLS